MLTVVFIELMFLRCSKVNGFSITVAVLVLWLIIHKFSTIENNRNHTKESHRNECQHTIWWYRRGDNKIICDGLYIEEGRK